LVGEAKTGRTENGGFVAAEDEGEDQADRDRVGHVGQEENGLIKAFERFDRVQSDRDHQSEHNRYRHGDEDDDAGIQNGLLEVDVLNDGHVVAKEGEAVDFAGLNIVSFHKRNQEGVDDRVERKDQ